MKHMEKLEGPFLKIKRRKYPRWSQGGWWKKHEFGEKENEYVSSVANLPVWFYILECWGEAGATKKTSKANKSLGYSFFVRLWCKK